MFNFSMSSSSTYGIGKMLGATRASGGFTEEQRNEVELFFFFAQQGSGASVSNLAAGVDWLRSNPRKHSLTEDKIDFIATKLGVATEADADQTDETV